MQTTRHPSDIDRRGFLQAGAAAGAGVLIGASRAADTAAPGAAAAPGGDLRVALIGLGEQGQVLRDAILKIPGVKIRAVCDIWEYSRLRTERLLQKTDPSLKGYVDFEEMLAAEAKNLDAAIVATPDFWHAPVTVACLKAGLHVYCEKMMSNDKEKAREMVRTMQQTGKLLQIGHQRRSNPRYVHAYRNLIQRAKLTGRMTHAFAQWNRGVSEDKKWPERYAIPDETLKKYGYESMHHFRNWRWYKKYGGGPISDLGAHQIDIFNWFFDALPKSVIAGGGVDFYKNHEWFDNVMAIFEYERPDGTARALYQVLTTTSAGGGYFEQFSGVNGTIKISENPSASKIYREPTTDERAWDEWVKAHYIAPAQAPAPAAVTSTADGPLDVRNSPPPPAYDMTVVLDKYLHQPHLENFFDAVRGKGKLTCPADEAFRSEAVVMKVNDAVAAGRKLDFTPEDFAV